jgi:hypothetical protein
VPTPKRSSFGLSCATDMMEHDGSARSIVVPGTAWSKEHISARTLKRTAKD